jgi:hypothetical protein
VCAEFWNHDSAPDWPYDGGVRSWVALVLATACGAEATPRAPTPTNDAPPAPHAEASPAVSSAAPRTTTATTRMLSPGEIDTVVRDHALSFHACYAAERARQPDLEGTVTIKWHIEADGSVSAQAIVSTTIGSTRVEECVLREIGSLHFPNSTDGVTVDAYPLKFVE